MSRSRDLASRIIKTATGGVLTLRSSDTTITDGSVLGKLEFNAPDEGSGTDALLVGAAIHAVAEGTFTASSNASELVFMTGSSEAASSKMVLSSGGNLSVAGTLTPTGVLTANAGVVVDNITIDGTEIDLSSGDLTLDVAGDIILDADGGDIKFKDGGTAFGGIFKSGNDLYLQSDISDGDIKFYGSDGGSAVTALTLDMSAAGAATFNSSVTATGLIVNASGGRQYINSGHIRLSDGYNIEWGGGTNFIRGNNSNGDMAINATGDLTIDVVGDITLDADGGDIILKDGGTLVGTIGGFASNNVVIKSEASDGDLVFQGNDGGSGITALTLDMSAAGAATFNGVVTANAGVVVDEMTLDGDTLTATDSFTIDAVSTIILDTDNAAIALKDNGVQIGSINLTSSDLQFVSEVSDKDMKFTGKDSGSFINALILDMSEAGAATFNGVVTANAGVVVDEMTIDGDTITATDDFTIDAVGDIVLDSDDANWRFKDAGTSILEIGSISGGPAFYSAVQDADMYFKGNDADGGAFTALTLDMSDQGTATFNHDVKMGDLCYLLLGAGNDLELVGDGTNGKIATGNGHLNIDSAGQIFLDGADDGTVQLRDTGTQYGQMYSTSGDWYFKSTQGDKDIIFQGVDGSSQITALTLDMSQAGEANFNSAVKVGGSIVAHQTNKGVLEYTSGIFMLRAYGPNAGTGSLQFKTGGGGGSTDSLAMTIDSSGNVGIGTVSGDVTSDGTAARTYVGIIGTGNRGRLNLGSTAVNGADSGTLSFVNGANELGALYMDTNSGVQNAGKMYMTATDDINISAVSDIISVVTSTNSTAGHHIFKSHNTEIMRIDGQHNRVGIGTDAPLDLLHLKGGGANNSTGAPIIRLQKRSAGSVDDGQTLGGISWFVNDDGVQSGASYERAKIIAESQNTSSGTRLEFWVGNSNADIAEAMRIIADGNVGIGTASPSCILHASTGGSGSGLIDVARFENEGTDANDGARIQLTAGTSTSGAGIGCLGDALNSAHLVFHAGGNTERMRLTSSGSLEIASGGFKAIGVYNNTTGTGANVVVDSAGGFARSTSSRRYKNTIEDATHGLTELLKLRPVTYKGNNDGDILSGGLIAEEVHDAGLTEFVTYNDDKEPDALAYGNMVSLCIKAIQELSAKNDALEASIAELKGN